MSFLWDKFNIKTFPAKTLVFLDGEFMLELSENSPELKVKVSKNQIEIINNNTGDLPVHIIYVGEIIGDKKIIIRIMDHGSQITHFTAKLLNKLPAFLQVFIENTGKNSVFNGNIVIQNFSDLIFNVTADHLVKNTGVFVKNRIMAHGESNTELTGITNIISDCPDCQSDLNFTAMCAPDAKIKMSPNQKISSIPVKADHSASIYHGSDHQIQFLSSAGISKDDIKKILNQAFLDE